MPLPSSMHRPVFIFAAVAGYTGFANGKTAKTDFTDWAIVKGELLPCGDMTVTTWADEALYPSEPIFVPGTRP